MKINELTLNNFRLYYGENKINLLPSHEKNVVIVSGKNGFGKTTFLMSLVWCLYGKQMENVDELYKKTIEDAGGYNKFISNSLNRQAKDEYCQNFSVSVVFKDVKVPEITCDEVRITRSYNQHSNKDSVKILIDGYENELIQTLASGDKQDGEEIFIRDYILPIEVAKFFFFDAEKIVSIAENNSPEQRQLISKAYTEVLGIKKYEDLKDSLETLQDDYRKKTASTDDEKRFNQIETDIKNKNLEIDEKEKNIQTLSDERADKKSQFDEIQHKLIKEGESMTEEELQELKQQEATAAEKIEKIREKLHDFYKFIPLGLAGETMRQIVEQIAKEKQQKEINFQYVDCEEKTSKIINEIEEAKRNSQIPAVDCKIRDFYEQQIRELIQKYFFSSENSNTEKVEILHDFSDAQSRDFETLVQKLRNNFLFDFRKMSDDHSKAKSELDSIRNKIRKAEKDADSPHVAQLRQEKSKLENRISQIDQEIGSLSEQISRLKEDIKTLKQNQENLRKKLDEARQFTDKEAKIRELIAQLNAFIKEFKKSKKENLSKSILEELQKLMHKNLFHRVEVDINQEGNDVDINLFDDKGRKIDKSSLSKGECQIYASALLKSLVDESDIDFPVFIDSPMQKFDREHAKNIIKEFYPKVSEQVILFPLLHKELTADEYKLLLPFVNQAFIIENEAGIKSSFAEIKPENLIQEYDSRYAN